MVWWNGRMCVLVFPWKGGEDCWFYCVLLPSGALTVCKATACVLQQHGNDRGSFTLLCPTQKSGPSSDTCLISSSLWLEFCHWTQWDMSSLETWTKRELFFKTSEDFAFVELCPSYKVMYSCLTRQCLFKKYVTFTVMMKGSREKKNQKQTF